MLKAPAVAAQLGISVRDLFDLANRGLIGCFRYGPRTMSFTEADVVAYKATLPAPAGLPPARHLREYERMRLRAVAVGADDLPTLTPEQLAIAELRTRRMRQPPWANGAAIRAIYDEAARLTVETGIVHHVDHDIPLVGEFVSGLHVETNLCVLTAADNIRKSNRFEVE